MQSSEPQLAGDRGLDAELDSVRDNAGLAAAMGQPEHLSLDDEEPATQRAYAEAASEESKSDQEEQPEALEVAEPDSFARAELAPESAVEELPAEVMAGVAQETAGQANASEAESAGAFAPGMPVTPLMPAPPAESQPAFGSASGGRSNRKKKRDQQRNAPVASSSGNGAEARPEDLPPSFEERSAGDNLALAQSTGEAIDKHADLAEKSQPAAQEGTNPEEIALWEAALENRSPVIRRQAARMLKKLTGKDYEV